MLLTPRAVPSSEAAIFIVFRVVCTLVGLSYGLPCSSLRSSSCDCSNIPDGYVLRCPAFTVEVKPKAVVRVQCSNNFVIDYSGMNGVNIGKVDTLIIRLCPLPSLSLSRLMQKLGVSNVSDVQLTYTVVNGNSATKVTRKLFHGLSNVTSLTLHTNGTTQLTHDVFFDMPNLTFIDLKSNNIVLPKNVFSSVMKLQVLQLYSCNQSFLEPGIFHNLIRLRILVLSGNMVNLSRPAFSDIKNLESLDINSTKITCLPSDLFVDLAKLRNVNLYANEFTSLPQKLFINNTDLETVNLQDNKRTLYTLPPRFLTDLSQLKVVKILNCNMSILPEDLLWGSASIHTISLNNNAFTTLPERLFKDCIKLQTLDISYNRITDLPDRLFFSVIILKFLKINNNQLSVISNQLFLPLRNLMILDLKDNRLTNIETDAFEMLASLKIVNMSNNMLTFDDTSKNKITGLSPLKSSVMLENIQLANNSLERIFPDWRNLKRLEILNLTYNKISQISFADLHFVSVKNTCVDVSYNNISEIDILGVTKDIVDSNHIKISMNSVVHFYRQIYGNISVRYIYIEGNHIKCDFKVSGVLHHFLWDAQNNLLTNVILGTNSKNLQCIGCEEYKQNQLLFLPLKFLTCLLKKEYSVDCPEQCSCLLLSSSKVLLVDCNRWNQTSMSKPEDMPRTISRDVFTKLSYLERLDIDSIKVPSLPSDFLIHLTNLKIINFYECEFERLHQNLFEENHNLYAVNIEGNRRTLTLPAGLLSYLTFLQIVTLRNCNISTLPEDLMWSSASIQVISLSNNAFATLPELLFRDCTKLHFLDMSYNGITNLPNELFFGLKELNILKINNNQLTIIQDNLFLSLRRLLLLDLKDNRLKDIESQAFVALHQLRIVDISNNMLTLTTGSSPLQFCDRLNDINLANNLLTKISVDWRKLENLQTLNVAHNKISQLQADDLYFLSVSNTFVNVSYNNITDIVLFNTESDVKYVPENNKNNLILRDILTEGNPINCDCKVYNLLQYHGGVATAEIKLKIKTEPRNSQYFVTEGCVEQQGEKIPMKFFTFLFNKGYNQNCPEQCICLFRSSDKALIVDCQQRNLTSVPEALPDIEFTNYTELNLSGNKIESIKFPLGPGYYKVSKYILSDNMINEIDLAAFSSKVQVLELDGNNISLFNKPSIHFLVNSTYLKMKIHNNPWRCDCKTKEFVTEIQSIYRLRKIIVLDNITCENGKQLLKVSETELCPVESEGLDYIGYSLVLLFGLLVGLLFAFYYKFQIAIKVWLYAHRCCLSFVTEEELDQNKLYDAFVSYAHQDEVFVMEHLVPRLEDEQYTLCLHQRDWIPGEFIPAQIAMSVEASRRTLIVLSPAFLESVWGRMEFCAAHKQALSERRVRVIVILFGDIGSTDKLDSELRSYLTMNTYVKWGEKWFWEKLGYAMPHSSKFRTDISLQKRASTSTHS